MAIAPPEPRWRRHGAIRAAELAEHPLILFDRGGTVRREIDAWFARARVTARASMELGNTEAMSAGWPPCRCRRPSCDTSASSAGATSP